MANVRTSFRIGPFRVNGPATLGIVIFILVVLVCGVVPCIVGIVAL